MRRVYFIRPTRTATLRALTVRETCLRLSAVLFGERVGVAPAERKG